MNLSTWIEGSLPDLVNELTDSIENGYHVESGDLLGLAGREDIYKILDGLLSVIFPGRYSKERIGKGDTKFYIDDILRLISHTFLKLLREVFHHLCTTDECNHCDCDSKAMEALTHLLQSLPDIRKTLIEDVQSGLVGDPAARSLDEIVLSYPFVDAIATYRIAHLLYQKNVPIIPRLMAERSHSRTGIDIHPGARIGSRFFIDHGTGVVIGETSRIGTNVKLYQGVTLGALSPFDKDGNPRKGEKRHPDIEDDVIIYANATILGGKTVIGKGSVIGGNTWITRSVPPGSVINKK